MSPNLDPDWREELDELIAEALAEPSVAGRADVFLAGLDEAIRINRPWAPLMETHLLREGVEKLLKREHAKRTGRVAVPRGTRTAKLKRVGGVRHRSADGTIEYQQALFDLMTWDQIREALVIYRDQAQTMGDKIYYAEKLLTLEHRVPGAATPAEACERLGIAVEDYLNADVGAA